MNANLPWLCRARARRFIVAVIASALLTAAVDALAGERPHSDLPGITSRSDLQSGVVPLKPPDVGFYMKIMQAALDRYQHPTAKDLADIAEAKRLRQLQLIGQAKMTEDFKAGNMQKGAEDMFHPTPEQSATMDRAAALTGGVPEMLAMDAGMPSGQWDELQRRVEYAAGIDNRSGYGSGDSGQAPALTPEQKARVSALLRTEAANKDLVAPSAGEIKRLSALVMQSGADSIQRNRDARP